MKKIQRIAMASVICCLLAATPTISFAQDVNQTTRSADDDDDDDQDYGWIGLIGLAGLLGLRKRDRDDRDRDVRTNPRV
jgi:MYXO-CTERM domain-containing protein